MIGGPVDFNQLKLLLDQNTLYHRLQLKIDLVNNFCTEVIINDDNLKISPLKNGTAIKKMAKKQCRHFIDEVIKLLEHCRECKSKK